MGYNSAIANTEGLDATESALVNDSKQIKDRVDSISDIGNRNYYCRN